jgi:hypothetical protein
MDSLQVLGERLDSSCITPSFGRMLSVRLVAIGTIVVIVPFFALLLLKTLMLLMLIFDPATCISVVDDIVQVAVVSATPLDPLLWWSDAAG